MCICVFHACVCMYTCACVMLLWVAHVCQCVCMSEVNLRCHSLSVVHLHFWAWNLPNKMGSLASNPQWSPFLCFSSTEIAIAFYCCYVGSGDWTRVLTFAQQAFHWMGNLLRPKFLLNNFSLIFYLRTDASALFKKYQEKESFALGAPLLVLLISLPLDQIPPSERKTAKSYWTRSWTSAEGKRIKPAELLGISRRKHLSLLSSLL